MHRDRGYLGHELWLRLHDHVWSFPGCRFLLLVLLAIVVPLRRFFFLAATSARPLVLVIVLLVRRLHPLPDLGRDNLIQGVV